MKAIFILYLIAGIFGLMLVKRVVDILDTSRNKGTLPTIND
jgi:hypothetical protein